MAHCAHRNVFPCATSTRLPAPRVAQHSRHLRRRFRHLAAHLERAIRLVVERTRDQRDDRMRYELADEHDAASHLAIGKLAPHVEAEVHLVEVPMERDRHTDYASVEK